MTMIKKLLRVIARPIRRGSEHKGRMIQPYRGYGSSHRLALVGRVFRQPGRASVAPQGRFLRDLLRFVRRLFRRGASDQEVVLAVGDREFRTTTDKYGYFGFRVEEAQGLPLSEGLNEVRLCLADDADICADVEIYVAPRRAGFVVISDIDDTVMYTGVANKLKMIWRLFATGAESREAFPGVGDFYRALHAGPDGQQDNPMLYVSRAPWSIYEMLEAFFQRHDIPVGPVLFLRDWGLTVQRPLPRRAVDHKRDVIEDMLDLYDDLPFVLIGDSGQHDPEVYLDIVERHPGRVTAVYIRDVTGSSTRAGEIEQLAEAAKRADCALLLSDNTDDMIEHARRTGLIGESNRELNRESIR
ncbi:phosphatase domain-containing protein [Halomonas denitrificans]|nr:DUF2183 domain-containing protein [Halomonas denitrificans]